MKTCKRCKQTKDLSAFGINRKSADGLNYCCKECLRTRGIVADMRKRCYNKNHKNYGNYGGRGITICDRWRDRITGIDSFIADMGPKPSGRHSIDRIDNNGNYDCGKCPDCHSRGVFKSNCRWATQLEQVRNRRRTPRAHGKSKYMGVAYHKKTSKWQSQYYNDETKRTTYIGFHKTEKEAAEAYNKTIIKLYGANHPWYPLNEVK